jgi:four helix bundle protein
VTAVRQYQDLVCWQLSSQLQDSVFALTATGPAARDINFRDQIRHSTRSATSNIAEGFGRYAPKEFRRFLSIARGSLNEAHNQVRIGHECGYFSSADYERLSRLAVRASKASARLMRYLDTCGTRPDRTS